jgi:Domain of unknown function (DUF4440)
MDVRRCMIVSGLLFVMVLVGRPMAAQAEHEQGSIEESKRQVLDLENRWLQIENDPSALEAILAPDFLHVVPIGIITKDKQLAFMRKHPSPSRPSSQQSSRHFEDMHVRIYGNVAIVNGHRGHN